MSRTEVVLAEKLVEVDRFVLDVTNAETSKKCRKEERRQTPSRDNIGDKVPLSPSM